MIHGVGWLMLRWMMDENGRPQSVTSQWYQDMLQQCIGRKSKIGPLELLAYSAGS